MKDLVELICAVFGALISVLFIVIAFAAGLAVGYGLAAVFWGLLVLLVTNVLLPLFDVHYELTLLQGFAGGLIIALVRTVLAGLFGKAR